jgi:hypothetical protein
VAKGDEVIVENLRAISAQRFEVLTYGALAISA